MFLRICESELKLNKIKCQVGVKSIVFHIDSVKKLQRFILNFAEVAYPLGTLLKKEVKFKLKKSQLDAVEKLKLLVTTAPCLKTFNTNLQSHLKIDVSTEESVSLVEKSHGALAHPKWYPVYICVTTTSRLQKSLRLNWKWNPFHSFWCWEIPWVSLWVKIYSNQWSPALKSIFNKTIVNCLPYIQKIFLPLQKY